MTNRIRKPIKSKKSKLEQALVDFSKAHPEIAMQMVTLDTPEARKAFAKQYMANRPKHPEQIIAYEMTPQDFTRGQWVFERQFVLRAFERGMFNKMIYTCPNGGGAHTDVRDKNALNIYLADIDRGFRENPQGRVNYAIGMNLEVQGYDPKTQSLKVEKDWRKFKGI